MLRKEGLKVAKRTKNIPELKVKLYRKGFATHCGKYGHLPVEDGATTMNDVLMDLIGIQERDTNANSEPADDGPMAFH